MEVVPRDMLQPTGPGDILAQQERAAEHGARASAMLQDREPVTEPRPAGAGPERVERAARAAPEHAMLPGSDAESLKRPSNAREQRLPERPSVIVAEPQAKAADWTAYHNPRFGFALKYPATCSAGRGETPATTTTSSCRPVPGGPCCGSQPTQIGPAGALRHTGNP